MGQRFTKVRTVYGGAVEMEQVSSRQLTEDGHHATRAVYVFHVVKGGAGRHLT